MMDIKQIGLIVNNCCPFPSNENGGRTISSGTGSFDVFHDTLETDI